jgi:hypothetical protein
MITSLPSNHEQLAAQVCEFFRAHHVTLSSVMRGVVEARDSLTLSSLEQTSVMAGLLAHLAGFPAIFKELDHFRTRVYQSSVLALLHEYTAGEPLAHVAGNRYEYTRGALGSLLRTKRQQADAPFKWWPLMAPATNAQFIAADNGSVGSMRANWPTPPPGVDDRRWAKRWTKFDDEKFEMLECALDRLLTYCTARMLHPTHAAEAGAEDEPQDSLHALEQDLLACLNLYVNWLTAVCNYTPNMQQGALTDEGPAKPSAALTAVVEKLLVLFHRHMQYWLEEFQPQRASTEPTSMGAHRFHDHTADKSISPIFAPRMVNAGSSMGGASGIGGSISAYEEARRKEGEYEAVDSIQVRDSFDYTYTIHSYTHTL